MPEYLGPFALGLFIGTVGATTALLAFVVVEYVEKEDEMMKDCLTKPMKVVSVCDLKVGDFIHDISYSSLADSEKRKGYVTYVTSPVESRMALGLSGRKRPLEVPITAHAVITQASLSATPRQAHALPPASGFASQLRPDKTPRQAVEVCE